MHGIDEASVDHGVMGPCIPGTARLEERSGVGNTLFEQQPESQAAVESCQTPEDVPMLPWTATEYKRRQDTLSKDDPVGHCNLPGVPQVNAVPYPYKILQSPTQITILYEAIRTFREIFIDGRKFPEDMQPAWLGYSIGHWDGDTLVVETAGQNDKSWLDSGGHPHTEQLRVTEKFRRRNFGTIDLETTIDDPGAYSKPWTVKYELRYMPDTELLEYVCTENNKDVEHLVGK